MKPGTLNTTLLMATAAALCACAPTATEKTTETPVTLSRTYPVSCTAALRAVQGAALRITAGDAWLTYHVDTATQTGVVLQAYSRLLPTTRTTSVWTCAQTVDAFTANSAVVTVNTTGLPSDAAQKVNLAFFTALEGR